MSMMERILNTGASQALPETDLGLDDVLRVLNNERRRLIIQALNQVSVGQSVSMKNLAQFVAAEQEGCRMRDLDAATEKRAYISLYQTHIPELADHRIVQKEDTQVEKRPRAADLGEILDVVDGMTASAEGEGA